ncbi:MAG: hypothetical protein R3F20_07100 [Planctomycetota bacterium]
MEEARPDSSDFVVATAVAEPRRSGPGCLLIAVVLLLVNAAALVAILRPETSPEFPDREFASRFAEALVRGGEGAERSGYADAWDLLSPGLAAELPLADFERRFEDIIAESGFLLDAIPDPELRGGTLFDRSCGFELVYSGLEGRPVSMTLRLRLALEDDRYAVSAFTVEPRER